MHSCAPYHCTDSVKVVGLIADIVESGEIASRAKFQRGLEFVLKKRSNTSICIGGQADATVARADQRRAGPVVRQPQPMDTRTAVGVLAHSLGGLKPPQMDELLGVTLRAVNKSTRDNDIDRHIALQRAITAEL